MIVSIVGTGDWPARRTGGPAVRTASAAAIASLLEQINALVQRIGHVVGGIDPFRKIQGCVHPAGDLPQSARRGCESAADGGRPHGAAQARHAPASGGARWRAPKTVLSV